MASKRRSIVYGSAIAGLALALCAGCQQPSAPADAASADGAPSEAGNAPAAAANTGRSAGGAAATAGAAAGGTEGSATGAPVDSGTAGDTAGAMAKAGAGAMPAADAAGPSADPIAPGLDAASLFPATDDLIGKAAPPFEAPLRDGTKVSLEAFKGRVIVLNFWATWCPPCIEELPSLERLRRRLKGQPIDIVGVSVDESWEPVDKLLETRTARFTLALDPSKAIPLRYGTSKFPETFIVDKRGTVVRKLIGAQIWDRGDFIDYLTGLAAK